MLPAMCEVQALCIMPRQYTLCRAKDGNLQNDGNLLNISVIFCNAMFVLAYACVSITYIIISGILYSNVLHSVNVDNFVFYN